MTPSVQEKFAVVGRFDSRSLATRGLDLFLADGLAQSLKSGN